MSWFRKAIGKVGGLAAKIAPFTAFIPGLNIGVGAAALIGGLGKAAQVASRKGAKGRDILKAGAGGAALGAAGNWGGGKLKGALGALGKLRGGGGGAGGGFAPDGDSDGFNASGQEGGEGGWMRRILGMGGDALGKLGGGNPLLGLGGLGMVGMDMYDQRQQRKSSEAFEQQKMDMMLAGMGKAEEDWDSRAGMREGGRAAVMQALAQMQQGDSINQHLNTMGSRRPGEFVARPGAV